MKLEDIKRHIDKLIKTKNEMPGETMLGDDITSVSIEYDNDIIVTIEEKEKGRQSKKNM